LQKLGLTLSETTVAKYLGRRRPPPSPTWRPFLANHTAQLASVDFFTVPTATFRVLFVFLVLSHDRRRIVHFNVTTHPTAAWTAQQLREAWPWATAPRCLVRDRDAIYSPALQRVAQAMDINDVRTAPRAPWQNPCVERVIARSAASASTTSSCGTSARCATISSSTSPTTTRGERISP
jgi:putative transposase